MLTRQQKKFYAEFSCHGTGSAQVEITPTDVAVLAHIAYFDIFGRKASWFNPSFGKLLKKGFYALAPDDIARLPAVSEGGAFTYLEKSGATNITNVIYLYLKNLCELHRRRFKFYNIMRAQPFPSADQVGLRCLLEFGRCPDKLLFSWMAWRKLAYDLDNRSAQETGYLFEPILSSCLGGRSVSHQFSPVKRLSSDGRRLNEGRQVDCYIEETKEVYELKLRVTIAASGQGRFTEELSFPKEAQKSGMIPVLVVFDPTPSPLLDKLSREYKCHGGRVAIGEDAWRELSEKAGHEMGMFILKYIKPPIEQIRQANIMHPDTITLSMRQGGLSISGRSGKTYDVPREALQQIV